MDYFNIEQSKSGRILLTRIGDLFSYIRRILGLTIVDKKKYEFQINDKNLIENIKKKIYLIRGDNYKPVFFVHGVLPRSGTNFIADLIGMHDDINSFPNQLWEFPLLSFIDYITRLESDFKRIIFSQPAKFTNLSFSAYINAGILKDIQYNFSPNKTMLFKFPFVHYLKCFRIFFPNDYLVLILRDGRDVVSSSIRTFKKKPAKFKDYCFDWNYATRCILNYLDDPTTDISNTIMLKYEEAFNNPKETIKNILDKFNFSFNKYDFNEIDKLPIRGSSTNTDKNGNVSWVPQKSKDGFNPIGRWREWSKSEKRLFKRIAGQTLIEAGYETNLNW